MIDSHVATCSIGLVVESVSGCVVEVFGGRDLTVASVAIEDRLLLTKFISYTVIDWFDIKVWLYLLSDLSFY